MIKRTGLAVAAAIVAALALVVFAPAAHAQSVVGTAHDLSSTGPGAQTNVNRVCVFCHTPHQAAAANAQDPLWNHQLSAVAAYGVYDSTTFDAGTGGAALNTITDIGAAVAGSASVSNLCMSCHDGTVAVHTLWNDPNEATPVTITAGGNVNGAGMMTGNPLVGTSLADDHPVNFDYDAALFAADNGGLNDPAGAAVAALLFGGQVQCASCHDPHDDSIPPFMVVDNTGSALCLTCHAK